jgi:hypothetical protein
MTKQVNTDDRSIHPEAFSTLQSWFGKFMVDLFASAENFKVAKFYSYAFSADSTGVDAFSMSWEGERAYCAPPITLILRTIRKIEVTKMTGVLLIPALARGAILASRISQWEAPGRCIQVLQAAQGQDEVMGYVSERSFCGQVGRLPRPGDRQPGGWRFIGVCGVAQPLFRAPFWI